MRNWTLVLALSAALAGGCVTHNSESALSGVIAPNCIEPATFGSAECAKGVSLLTRQSVTSDRCVESIRHRDTRDGTFNRAALC